MQWAARGAAAPVVSGTTAVTVVGQQQHAPGSFSSTSSTPRPVAHLDMDVGRGHLWHIWTWTWDVDVDADACADVHVVFLSR